MTTRSASQNEFLGIDTVYKIPSNEWVYMSREGLVFFQEDTAGITGKGIMVVSPDFPKYRQYEDLIKPLRYLSTNKEWNTLEISGSPKTAFEQFWLKVGQTPDNASELIRSFYRRVTYANETFSTYKEGWKTDMGMIYIVFGKPDRIEDNGTEITWHYTNSPYREKVDFLFIKRNNIFTEHHYQLQRNKDYIKPWNEAIRQWRIGNPPLE
ncbi:hypothetical protein GCM10023331_15920 [Algivirga pacifica]|uniref:GWxTD domain-containing protein n=2 Tax=Algivirga pacifica TaxID=1162670 RepID=A0ABP9D7F6_9BACT